MDQKQMFIFTLILKDNVEFSSERCQQLSGLTLFIPMTIKVTGTKKLNGLRLHNT